MSVQDGIRIDPYKNYKFVLKYQGNEVLGVSKASTLKKMTEVISYRSGGQPDRDIKVPGRVTYDAITLERGITNNDEFEQWATTVHPTADGDKDLENFRRNLELIVRDETGADVIRYFLNECWVSEWTALPELDASANALAIESIKLEVGYWARDDAL